MHKISEYTELKIPDYALSYLVNADSSGLETEDIESIDSFMEQFYTEAKENHGHVIFSIDEITDNDGDILEYQEPYFCSCPRFGLPCDVVDCTVLIVK